MAEECEHENQLSTQGQCLACGALNDEHWRCCLDKNKLTGISEDIPRHEIWSPHCEDGCCI